MTNIKDNYMNNYKKAFFIILGTTRFDIVLFIIYYLLFMEVSHMFYRRNRLCCNKCYLLSVNVKARSEEVKTFC